MPTASGANRPGRHRSNGRAPEPAWGIARLFPAQGAWAIDDYLSLSGNHLVEFDRGFVEVLPMPTTSHQWIMLSFWEA